MTRMTLWRFSKATGIPVEQIDMEILEQMQDKQKLYKNLCFLKQLREAAKLSNKTPREILNWLQETH